MTPILLFLKVLSGVTLGSATRHGRQAVGPGTEDLVESVRHTLSLAVSESEGEETTGLLTGKGIDQSGHS